MESEKLFVSYSRKDAHLVQPVVKFLRAFKLSIFRDEEDIQAGKQWQLVIAEELKDSTFVVVFWSKAAAKSIPVQDEYHEGIRTGKQILPVLLDGTDLPADLAAYQWVDFRPFQSKRARNWITLLLSFSSVLSLGILLSLNWQNLLPLSEAWMSSRRGAISKEAEAFRQWEARLQEAEARWQEEEARRREEETRQREAEARRPLETRLQEAEVRLREAEGRDAPNSRQAAAAVERQLTEEERQEEEVRRREEEARQREEEARWTPEERQRVEARLREVEERLREAEERLRAEARLREAEERQQEEEVRRRTEALLRGGIILGALLLGSIFAWWLHHSQRKQLARLQVEVLMTKLAK